MSVSYLERHPHYYASQEDSVDVFAPFTILSEPLPTRESRVFDRIDGGTGVTYASHSIKLACKDSDKGREFFILMEHGGGREISRFKGCFNYDLVKHILAMPERAQYSLLYSIHGGASDIARNSSDEGKKAVLKAHIEKRIRKRTSGGKSTWKVESRQEQKWRLEKSGKKIPQYVD